MRWLPALVVLLATSIARAAPCDVEVLRAPDGVATEIETWMRAEPSCRWPLQVRVVETTDGLYVVAQDPSGTLHERVVPDARTAAVLVASWAADDGAAPAPIMAVPVVPVAILPEAPMAPGNTPIAIVAKPEPRYLVDVGGMLPMIAEGGVSLRIGIDALHLGPASFGVAAAYETTRWTSGDPALNIPSATALQAFARIAFDHAWGRVAGRAELAAGFAQLHDDAMSSSTVTTGMVEGSLTAGLWVTPDWRLRGGPLIASVPEASFATFVLHGGSDLRLWVGIDRRL